MKFFSLCPISENDDKSVWHIEKEKETEKTEVVNDD